MPPGAFAGSLPHPNTKVAEAPPRAMQDGDSIRFSNSAENNTVLETTTGDLYTFSFRSFYSGKVTSMDRAMLLPGRSGRKGKRAEWIRGTPPAKSFDAVDGTLSQ